MTFHRLWLDHVSIIRSHLLQFLLLTALCALGFITPASSAEISVQSATYGPSCGIKADNAGSSVKLFCDGREKCGYLVNIFALGDPAPGCKKDFVVHYTCQGGGEVKTASVPAEAGRGSQTQLDCSGVTSATPTTPAPKVSSASETHVGFALNELCIGACPPSNPIREGEKASVPISFRTTLPNGDRFSIAGLAKTGFEISNLEFDSPLAVQYLGNDSNEPSQDDDFTADFFRRWQVGRNGAIPFHATHTMRTSTGVAPTSHVEVGLSGSDTSLPGSSSNWISLGRWVAPQVPQPLTTIPNFALWSRDGVMSLSFRFGIHFAAGSKPGSFILIDGANPPPLTVSQLLDGEGLAQPSIFNCDSSMPPPKAMEIAKRAARQSYPAAALRCLIAAAQGGDAGAANDVGFAIEHGITVFPDLQMAAQWYEKAAEKDDTLAQDRLAHVLKTGKTDAADIQEAQRWSSRAQALREARSKVCEAPSIAQAIYAAAVAEDRSGEAKLGKMLLLGMGTEVKNTILPPFKVKIADLSWDYGPFKVDMLSQSHEFLCVGYFKRGEDDGVVPTLNDDDIDRLRADRNVELSDSARAGLSAEINHAEEAQGVANVLNGLLQHQNIYTNVYYVKPLENGRYSVTLENSMLAHPRSVDVDGPALQLPP